MNELIKQNKGLVISIAKRYQGRGLELDDLMQEGYIGLLEAWRRYDIGYLSDDGKSCKFSTYATYWIKQAITKAIAKTGSLIPISQYGLKNSSRLISQVYDNNRVIDNISEISFNNLLNKIKQVLGNDRDIKIYLDYYLLDKGTREIGRGVGFSHVTINKRLKILQAKIKRGIK